MRLPKPRPLALLVLGIAFAGPATAESLAELAGRLVRAYGAGDVEALRPHLAPDMRYRDLKSNRELDLAAFLAEADGPSDGDTDSRLEIDWIGLGGDLVEVRGSWSRSTGGGEPEEGSFSIELYFITTLARPLVTAWVDDLRAGSMWKPARGSGQLESEHFRIVYFARELPGADAERLGATLEKWYARTSDYLGRAFSDGYRLHVNVADAHPSPYASAPGPDAFILVSSRSARREYGFSLVHELTHNLMGLSWLSRHQRQRGGVDLTSGNRLFDEGFAVFVEEELTGEGPRVWPNFGEETHAGYWRLREEKGEPIWPVLEAESQRQRGHRRLAYLAQGSFCKYLVETHGLERFQRLYAGDPEEADAIYGRDLAALEDEWRSFLEARFATSGS